MYVGHYELVLDAIPVIEFRIEEPKTFGEYIRKLRILKGWSQRELASRIGAQHSTIVNWEKSRYVPRRKTVVRLVKVLDADPWAAIEFDGVITERQREIIKAFPNRAFIHKDCVNLLGARYLYDDLAYLVNLKILEKQFSGSTGYYQIAGFDQ